MRKFVTLIAALTITLFMSGKALACNQSSGELTKVDPSKKAVVVSAECECGSGKSIETTYTLKESTKVLLNGKEVTLADLKSGDKVQVDYEAADDVLKISATREG